MPHFELQFPVEQLAEYAARYAYEGDGEVLAMARTARDRGHFTRDEFQAICRWKTPRSKPLVEANGAKAIEAATRIALGSGDERERIDALRSLSGVGWATASVFLHLAFLELYPILDRRALHAFGVQWPKGVSFKFWLAYVEAWRALVAQADTDGRTVDQGMWQWSKEQGVPLY